MSSIVIIGAGECGGRAALELRDRGFAGNIALVGAEEIAPYERPPLSKDGIVSGAAPRFIVEREDYGKREIDLRTGTWATAIDRVSRTVSLSDGAQLSYDKLLLSTGARPRMLAGHAENSPRVMTLRTHSDALAIKGHLKPGSRVAIIGGGFIGLELAAVASGLGASVTLLEGLPRLLSRGVPTEIAEVVANRHREAGVEILYSVRVDEIAATESEVSIALADGRKIVADVVVVGIGSIPNTELAEAAGLVIDNGIAVDNFLRSSDADIFAAGDCCSFPVGVYGGKRVRLESWRSAQEQGRIAAANMLGAEEPIRAVPWFWSDQFDLTLQVAGLSEGAILSVRREIAEGAFIVFQLDEASRLLAASGIGPGNAVARDIRLAEMLIAKRIQLDPVSLASPEIKLKSFLSS
jgi:3-phenylpropionate/trans-cinnamate dioxygenase ferredoxin reductase subunit